MNKKDNLHIRPLTESYEKRSFTKLTAGTSIPPRPSAPAAAKSAKLVSVSRAPIIGKKKK